MVHPFLRDLRPTIHISHRGGAEIAPENTMVAFRLAVERFKTDMLEIDVHTTSDGELVVLHDEKLDRTTDMTGSVTDHTWSELATADAGYRFTRDGGRTFPFRGKGVRIPRLQEVLSAFPHQRFNVEVKDDVPSIEDGFADVIGRTGSLARVCVGSEDDQVSKRVVRALPDACHFYPRRAVTNLIIGLKAGDVPSDSDPYDVLDIPLYFGGAKLVDTELLFRAARAGRWVNVWTINDRSEMERLVEDQVGGIMTDRPDLLREVLDGRSRGMSGLAD